MMCRSPHKVSPDQQPVQEDTPKVNSSSTCLDVPEGSPFFYFSGKLPCSSFHFSKTLLLHSSFDISYLVVMISWDRGKS
ncbi:hypothetical protein FQA47_018695 [Oryzias melastigma]|uniref:Uncharacterized protein n=1 Tax=Oryzias melastigma TaxID=30732 RepID=A0A834C9N5_ORYME|nr:hypothetical protein FQA47_018695 [Oryzias melastigma]